MENLQGKIKATVTSTNGMHTSGPQYRSNNEMNHTKLLGKNKAE